MISSTTPSTKVVLPGVAGHVLEREVNEGGLVRQRQRLRKRRRRQVQIRLNADWAKLPEGWSFKEVGESARPADYSRWSLGYADNDALAFVQTRDPRPVVRNVPSRRRPEQ